MKFFNSRATRVLVVLGCCMAVPFALSACTDSRGPAPHQSATIGGSASSTPTPSATPTPTPTPSNPDTALPPGNSATPKPSASSSGERLTASLVMDGIKYDTASQSVIAQGFVTSAIENGGTCTLTLTRSGSANATGTASAYADATVTYCRAVSIPRTSLTSGTYTAVLTYESSKYRGATSATTVQVP